MDDEKLLSIAEELGIKGAKKKDKEALVYEIMDKEAVIDSQKEPEKPARKRGRPKKNTPADQSGKPAAKASKEEKAQPAETGKPDTDLRKRKQKSLPYRRPLQKPNLKTARNSVSEGPGSRLRRYFRKQRKKQTDSSVRPLRARTRT